MIYVEGKPDQVLVQVLTELPRREIARENGKFEVAKKIRGGRNNRGMVDEDPGYDQPAYFMSMTVQRELQHRGLRVLEDSNNGNLVVVLCPKLEDWVIRAVDVAGVRMVDYNLPGDPSGLKRAVMGDIARPQQSSRFWRLLRDLRDTPMLRCLRGLLQP